MSTKTSIKRIALVAVSALGFGLLGAAPSRAGEIAASAVTLSSTLQTVQAGTAITAVGITPTVSANLTADADTVTLTVSLTKPALSAVTLANKNGDANANDPILSDTNKATVADLKVVTTNVATGVIVVTGTDTKTVTAAAASAKAGELVFTPDVPGIYTLKVASTAGAGATTGAGTLTVNVLPSTSTTSSLTASVNLANISLVDGTSNDAVVTISRNVGGAQTDGQILGRVDATPDTSLGAPGTIFGNTAASALAAGFKTVAASGANVQYTMDVQATAAANVFDTAGTYTYTFFQDTNSNNLLDSGEPTTTISIVIGGAPADTNLISMAIDNATRSSDSGWNEFTVTVTLTDSLGRPTNDTVYVIETTALGAVTNTAADPLLDLLSVDAQTALTRIGTTNRYTGTFSVKAGVSGDYQDTYLTAYSASIARAKGDIEPIRVVNSTALLNTTINATAFEIVQPSTDTPVGTISTTTGLRQSLAGTFAASATTTSVTATVDKTYTTHTWKIYGATGQEGEYVRVEINPTGSTASTVVAPRKTLVMMGADLTASFTVTATSPASSSTRSDSYEVIVRDGTNTATGTVTFGTATPRWTVSPSANYSAKFGDASTVTGKLTDNFGRVLSAKSVYVDVVGRNAGRYTGTTSALGEFAFTWTDASASTTVLTDALTFKYDYLATAASTSFSQATGARTVTYSAAGLDITTVTVGAPSGTNTRAIDMSADSDVAASSRVVFTATVKDSKDALVKGALVTFAGGADDLFYGGNTGVTDEFGQASVEVYRLKTGTSAITATAGGKTATAGAITWSNNLAQTSAPSNAPVSGTADIHARYITLTADQAKVASEGIIRFTAKVTDRFGNPVAGAEVTFSETGAGRFYNAPSGNKGDTNSAGEISIDLNSQAGEVGTASVTAAITEASTRATQINDTAGIVTVTPTVGSDGTTLATAVRTAIAGVTAAVKSATATATIEKSTAVSTADALLELAKAIGTGNSANAAADAALEAIDAANAATDAANLAAEAADAATVAAEEARDAADAATAAVEALASEVATLVAALKAQITTLANTVAKIAKRVKA